MFTFDLYSLYNVILLAFGIPGMILSLALFSKDKELSIVEILLAGIAIGIIETSIIGVVPMIFNIQFSTQLVYIIVAISYIISVYALFVRRGEVIEKLLTIKSYASAITHLFSKKDLKWDDETKRVSGIFLNTIALLALLFLMFSTFHIRMQSFSPIFQELDPYFYLYSTFQLLSYGYVPYKDTTAWFPHFSSHRTMPLLVSFESIMYKLNVGDVVDIYKLSGLANVYPPLVASLAVFFIYLLIYLRYKNRWIGLSIAYLLSFLPTFLLKTMSGEFEVQPFAFFGISFMLFSIYYLIHRKNSYESIVLLLLSALGLSLASASSIVIVEMAVLAGLIIFAIGLINGREINKDVVRSFSIIALVFFIVAIFDVSYTLSIHRIKRYLPLLIPPILMYGYNFSLKHYNKIPLIKSKIAFREASILFSIILIILLFITPLGSDLLSIARSSASVGEYNTPLEWTIAEQNPAGRSMAGYLGAIGTDPYSFLSPISQISAVIVNSIMQGVSVLINNLLGLSIKYIPKDPGLYMIIILSFFILSIAYGIAMVSRKEIKDKYVFFAIIISLFLPIFTVGVFKAKYIIYFGYVFVVMLGFVFGEFVEVVERFSSKFLNKNDRVYVSIVSIILFYLLFLHPNISNPFNYYISLTADVPKVSLEPNRFTIQLSELCSMGISEACNYPSNVNDISDQFDYKLCYYTTLMKLADRYGDQIYKNANAQRAASLKCQVLPRMWITSMEWISKSTPEGSRILSWWDYGHWINYFGQRNAVIRNEHSYLDMILRTAYVYVMGSEDDLIKEMKDYNATYVLFDSDLIMAGTGLGGKFGALNYLACNYANLTNVSNPPGTSLCEKENLWETVIVDPSSTCVVSNITKRSGHIAYRLSYVKDPFGGFSERREKAYCLSTAKLADGSEVPALYYLNETTETGDLKINKGFLLPYSQNVFNVVYLDTPDWIENGTVVSGYSDRKGRFYDSILFKGFFLGHIKGFEKVYDNGNVKIYKLVENN